MTDNNWIPNFKCRCSGINKMMSKSQSNPTLTEKQAETLKKLEAKDVLTENQRQEMAELIVKRENGKKIILSDTCIEYLMEVYALETEGKLPLKEQFEIDQMKKGKLCEEDSILLLTMVEGIVHVKNIEQISNEFLKGEPDVYAGDEIMKAEKITDIKSCWDYPIFLKKIHTSLETGWMEQVQGYMDITTAPKGQVSHCLVDMPEIMRLDFKKKMFYKGEYVSEESPDFLRKWKQLEHSMIFSDIPEHKRVFSVPVEPFSSFRRQEVYDKVKICREWLQTFHETYQNLNL